MSKLYIVSSRCGTELCAPHTFKSEESADRFIRTCIVNDLCGNHEEEMDAAGLDCNSDPNEIITWGIANDLCALDAYTGSDEWHEFQVSTVLTDAVFHEEILSLMDELEEIRQKAAENPLHYPTDYAIRLCEATVAEKCRIQSRVDWTSELKANPKTKYYERYHNGNFHI